MTNQDYQLVNLGSGTYGAYNPTTQQGRSFSSLSQAQGFYGTPTIDFTKAIAPSFDVNKVTGANADQLISFAPPAPVQVTPPASPTQVNTPPTTVQSPQLLQMPSVQNPPAPTAADTFGKAAGYTGNSISDFLVQAGQAADLTSRTALANKYGISNYTGTGAQNTQLLGILKSIAKGNVNSTGVPTDINKTLGVGTVPNGSQPIDIGSLTGDTDIDSILKSSVQNGTISSTTAGLLALLQKPSTEDQQYDDLSKKLSDAMTSEGSESADLQTELEKQGVPEAQTQLKSLNLIAAQLQGELSAYDAETASGTNSIGNKDIPEEFITGQTAAYNNNRAITRNSKAAQLASTTSLIQAYQGNITLGSQLAQQAVDLKYAPIENSIKVLQTQLQIASDKMSSADQKRSSIISAILDQQAQEVSDKKQTASNISQVAVQAAANGAPLTLVAKMQAAPDAATAATIGAAYLKGNLETTGGGGSGGSDVKFTDDDVRKLTASGLNSSEITNLKSDINTYGFDTAVQGLSTGQKNAVKTILGGTSADATNHFIDANYLITLYGGDEAVQKAAKDNGQVTQGSFFGTSKGDSGAFITSLLNKVNQYRQAGYTDNEILKLIQG